MELVLFFGLAVLSAVGLVAGLVVAKRSDRPQPALPVNCGDCVFMVPRARVYRRDTVEDEDGLIHYLCEKRWIEVTPYSPWCDLGRSKSRVLIGGKVTTIGGSAR